MSENKQNRPQKSNWFLYTLCSFSLLTSFIYLVFAIIQLSSIEFLSKKIAYATDLVDRIDEENIQQLSLIVNDVKVQLSNEQNFTGTINNDKNKIFISVVFTYNNTTATTDVAISNPRI